MLGEQTSRLQGLLGLAAQPRGLQSQAQRIGPPGDTLRQLSEQLQGTRRISVIERPLGSQQPGAFFGGARGRTDVPKIVDWYMNGKIEIDPMITHVLSLDEINHGFDLMHRGESIRSVVVF